MCPVVLELAGAGGGGFGGVGGLGGGGRGGGRGPAAAGEGSPIRPDQYQQMRQHNISDCVIL